MVPIHLHRFTHFGQAATSPELTKLELPNPAAVCVYLPFVSDARKNLEGTSVKVATVAAAFPHGQSPLEIKKHEVELACELGADEVDIVISRGTGARKQV